MIAFINITIWVLFVLVPVILIFIYRKYINKKPRRYIWAASSFLVASIAIIIIFYYPIHMAIPNSASISVRINSESLENAEQINELIEIIEKQPLIRSTRKTLEGVPPYPFEMGIDIIISGMTTPYYAEVFIHKDSNKLSFVKKDGQYYNFMNPDKVVQEMLDLLKKD